jgi:hypothetical protein
MSKDKVVKGSEMSRHPVIKGIVVPTNGEDGRSVVKIGEHVSIDPRKESIPVEIIIKESMPGLEFPEGALNSLLRELPGSQMNDSIIGFMFNLFYELVFVLKMAQTHTPRILKILSQDLHCPPHNRLTAAILIRAISGKNKQWPFLTHDDILASSA